MFVHSVVSVLTPWIIHLTEEGERVCYSGAALNWNDACCLVCTVVCAIVGQLFIVQAYCKLLKWYRLKYIFVFTRNTEVKSISWHGFYVHTSNINTRFKIYSVVYMEINDGSRQDRTTWRVVETLLTLLAELINFSCYPGRDYSVDVVISKWVNK